MSEGSGWFWRRGPGRMGSYDRARLQALAAALRPLAMAVQSLLLAAGLALTPLPVAAQTLLEASYDPGRDRLVLEIAYQGTNPNHQFVLEWGACEAGSDGKTTAVGRLIDSDGQDAAREDYQVWRRFDLAGLSCRPADVTIRLGPVSNRTVSVPAPRR